MQGRAISQAKCAFLQAPQAEDTFALVDRFVLPSATGDADSEADGDMDVDGMMGTGSSTSLIIALAPGPFSEAVLEVGLSPI